MTNKVWNGIVCLCLLGFGLLSARAHAQAAVPEHYAFSVGTWKLLELKDTSGVSMGFWAIPKEPVTVGNIRRMWFEALANDEWAVWAFEPVSIETKIDELVAAGLNNESELFLRTREWKAALTAINQGVDGGVDGLVTKGFIDGDPMTEPTASLSDPTPMIDLLAGVGYPIAPGMTDMLVNGTAGTNVNMNQATKQLLNCLRSTASSCGECVCVETEAMIERGPWTVQEFPPNEIEARLRCVYTRILTHSYWQYGEFPEDCTDCTEGSADAPSTWTETEGPYEDYWLEIEHCPDTPVGIN